MTRIKTDYQIGGSIIKMAPLEWLVYQPYEIISVIEYVHRQKKEAQERFLAKYPEFFDQVYDELADTMVIVPDYSVKPTMYYPLEEGPQLLTRFSKLHKDNNSPQDDELLNWINQFGLPLNTSKWPRANIFSTEGLDNSTDQLLKLSLYFERILENMFGHYIMFRQTFHALAEEASMLLHAYTSFSTGDINGMYEAFIVLETADYTDETWTYINEVKYDIQWENYIRSSITKLLVTRIVGYLNRLSPSLATTPMDSPPYILFTPSWRIPDLWTALISQFYEHMIKNQPIKFCSWCNEVFVPTHKSMKYCPAPRHANGLRSYNETGRSDCQNLAAVTKHRNKLL